MFNKKGCPKDLSILIIVLCSPYTILSVFGAPSEFASETNSPFASSSSHSWVLGAAIVLVTLVLAGMAIMTCMDCMNSEVSSESHPACGDNTPKWGGAANYHRAGGGEGGTDSCYVSEVVHPSDLRNAALPYSMIPTQLPDPAEFRGYQSGGGGGGGGSSGMAGYNLPYASASAPPGGAGSGAHMNMYGANSGFSGGHGRHYNPAEGDDPPPAYNEATNR
ncbi:nuclear respiratory factor 1 [Plakobranchus ocellatus]|uniref:Nuclear respiratory factor 1 n=1 Tax=Plakobranchus ocellatus TaxID=259542 RepID=A0AAV4DIT2_9GAST|nr:nuclear respiratory factor 1 [Plakobranchus ocellatus]